MSGQNSLVNHSGERINILKGALNSEMRVVVLTSTGKLIFAEVSRFKVLYELVHGGRRRSFLKRGWLTVLSVDSHIFITQGLLDRAICGS